MDYTRQPQRPYLKERFSAYHSPRDLKEDSFLTRVGRGTPCGEYFRRFWQPVGFVGDLGDLAVKVKILGEDLVLYKDRGGRIGLLEQHCSHRGASLEFGVIGEHGIRCFYHGWMYDHDGTVMETPSGTPLEGAGEIHHGAYPVHVYAGMVFAYMGPPDKKPPFPILDIYDDEYRTAEPGNQRTAIVHGNWLQVSENGMDPIHTAFLHVLMSGQQRGFSKEMGILPVLQYSRCDTGSYYIASRRKGDKVWVRILDKILPNYALVPPDDQSADRADVSQGPFTVVWSVPMDDYTTKRMYLMINDKRAPLEERHRRRAFGQSDDRTYEERQRHPGDYDAATSQGPINIHAYENLTSSDPGVLMYRDELRRGIVDVQSGRDPLGVFRDVPMPLKTRTQNTVVHAPPAASPEADIELLKKIGREVADGNHRDRFPPR